MTDEVLSPNRMQRLMMTDGGRESCLTPTGHAGLVATSSQVISRPFWIRAASQSTHEVMCPLHHPIMYSVLAVKQFS